MYYLSIGGIDMLISLTEYGKLHNKSADTIRRLAENGKLTTARKIGRNWVVDSEEKYPISIRILNQTDHSFLSTYPREINMRYSNETLQKSNGIVYTPPILANYVANQILKNYDYKLSKKEFDILDPAIGEGELIIALIQELSHNFNDIHINIYAYETNSFVIDTTTERIKQENNNVTVTIINKSFLDSYASISKKYDFVIANPPYIRTQILGTETAQKIASLAGLDGRVDIYYAFLVFATSLLKPNGLAGFITSNKFMTIKSGRTVRKHLLKTTDILSITDFGDTKLFNASVLPCVIVFRPTQDKTTGVFTSIYESQSETDIHKVTNIFEGLDATQTIITENKQKYDVIHGFLEANIDGSPWRIRTESRDKWLDTIDRNTCKRFSDLGKIRVGIKTTADNVFIMEKWSRNNDIPELLRPLITHRNAGQITSENSDFWNVLYTHTIKAGKKTVYNIDEYPNSKKYLELHRKQLEGRSYIKNANRNWYEIWVPQNPASWSDKKIIFRDITATPQFWLDDSGAVVNGDCYWIDIHNSVSEDEIYMALAIANSTFIEKYYDAKFNNKLYSGKRRFMSQYVADFPLPDTSSPEAQKVISLVQCVIKEKPISQCKDKIIKEISSSIDKLFNS
jgi:hypothetical protein